MLSWGVMYLRTPVGWSLPVVPTLRMRNERQHSTTGGRFLGGRNSSLLPGAVSPLGHCLKTHILHGPAWKRAPLLLLPSPRGNEDKAWTWQLLLRCPSSCPVRGSKLLFSFSPIRTFRLWASLESPPNFYLLLCKSPLPCVPKYRIPFKIWLDCLPYFRDFKHFLPKRKPLPIFQHYYGSKTHLSHF